MADGPTTINIKIIFLGNSGAGKSSLLWRYNNPGGNFNDEIFTTTLGVDYFSTIKEVGDKTYKLCLWDTAGQERFRTIIPTYFKSSNGVVYVFDLSNKTSFDDIKYWHDFYMKNTTTTEVVPCILLGNKCDKDARAVSSEEGKTLAKEIGAKYFETSVPHNTNVTEAIESLFVDSCKGADPAEPEEDPTKREPEKRKCC
eukprot:gnl/Chilomastix_caulleri/1785.p1 GENE.gnl/Chilomastix_caulleri/1785~~gnl/Chilomastix_caulleri/1785.p1  ORF type:complete len:199 (-),score=27.60 gnl/Chilomastix_caulleri/1785:428-1024(-)